MCISGSSLGGVIWPIVADQLLNKHDVSFGWTMRIVGFIMIPLAIFASLTIRLPVSKEQQKTDQEIASDTKTENTPKPKKKMDLSVVKNPVYIAFVVGVTIFNLGYHLLPFPPLTYTNGHQLNH